MPDVEDGHIVATTDEARAATAGQGLRYVLGFGTAGVIVLFAIAYVYFFA